MRRITTWLLSTVTALVLLFSYHTSTDSGAAASVVAESDNGTSPAAGSGSTDTPSTGSGDSGSSSSGSGASGDSGSSSADSGSSSSAATTYTGDAVSTRFGDVQVEITVEDGKVTDSQVTRVPWNDHKDQEINAYAVPILNSEAVKAQSADIDMVSGATYTSQGYIRSLQSAIDQANL
jgi:uncharacterized protein with FMN-binding domain